MKYNTQLPDDSVNVSKKSIVGDLVWMLGGIMMMLLILYFSLGYIVEYGVKNISVTQEEKIFSFFKRTQSLSKTANLAQTIKLDEMLKKAQQCTDMPYQFSVQILDSKEINAFALPGGYIVVTNALLANVKSENELFFVLSHELGHFKNRDHLKGLGRAFVSKILGYFIGLSDVSEILNTSLSFSESKFSKEQETQADLFAVDMTQCAYGHINGVVDFFQNLPSENHYMVFSSHPDKQKRIDDINDYGKKKHYTIQDKIKISYGSSPKS